MIKLKILGSGSAFCNPQHNFNSMILVQFKCAGEGIYRNLLLDCGSDFKAACFYHGIRPTDIDAVYVSHLHGDHIGGLEYLAFASYFMPPYRKPKLFITSALMKQLWDDSLKGGLESLATNQIRDGKTISQLDTYFEPYPVMYNESFEFEGIKFSPIQMVHIVTGRYFKETYGLMIDTGYNKIFWTSDTQFAPKQLFGNYKEADIIIHDCETGPFKSDVHAHYTDLITLPSEIKEKMWLIHYQDNPIQDASLEGGFAGFLQRGQEIEVN